jgi:hypothetical protein
VPLHLTENKQVNGKNRVNMSGRERF